MLKYSVTAIITSNYGICIISYESLRDNILGYDMIFFEKMQIESHFKILKLDEKKSKKFFQIIIFFFKKGMKALI